MFLKDLTILVRLLLAAAKNYQLNLILHFKFTKCTFELFKHIETNYETKMIYRYLA